MSIPDDRFASAIRRVFTLAVILTAILVGLGLRVFPAALSSWKGTVPGLAGVGTVLGAYAMLGTWGAARLEQIDVRLLRLSVTVGLVSGAIYAIEIMLEYVLLPKDNTRYGYFEFGLVFLCYFIAGLLAGLWTRRALNGLFAALGASLISTLLWYLVLLAITYVMKGTPQQVTVFQAEGDLEDFRRSGSANFEAWLMQDFLGAGFYHLLLAAVIASALGLVGGSFGRIFRRRVPVG